MRKLGILLTFLLFLFASVAQAENDEIPYSAAAQFGIDIHGDHSPKLLGLALSGPLPVLPEILVWEIAGGTYNEANFASSPPRWFGDAALGVEVHTAHSLYGRILTGVGYASHDTARISGRLQFRTTVGFGLYNDRGRVGLLYSHISNAGRRSPNGGYDHIGLEAALYFTAPWQH